MKIAKVLKRDIIEEQVTHPNVHLVELDDGSKGIWKIDRKYYTPPITALKEVVAYRIDQWLGLGVIPETDFCRFEDEPGSLQRFVEGTVGTKALATGKPAIDFEWMQRLSLFDFVSNNCDRFHPNFIVREDGRVFGIDNAGVLQTRDACTQGSIWVITGIALPEDLKAVVLKARENISDLVRTIFNIRYESRDGIVTGRTLDIGINIMCSKLAALAGSLGYSQSLYETYGCFDYNAMKERDKL